MRNQIYFRVDLLKGTCRQRLAILDDGFDCFIDKAVLAYGGVINLRLLLNGILDQALERGFNLLAAIRGKSHDVTRFAIAVTRGLLHENTFFRHSLVINEIK